MLGLTEGGVGCVCVCLCVCVCMNVCVIKAALLPAAKAANPITGLYRLAHSLIRA